LEEQRSSVVLPAAVLSEPVPTQEEKPLPDQGQATVLAEPVAAQREGRKREESDVRDLEVQMDRGLSAERDEARQGDDGVARKVARSDPGNALEFLERAEVRKACAYLETLPANAQVDKLRNLLESWRAVREHTTCDGQRTYLRQVARSFKITLARKNVGSPYLASGKISAAFVEEVSALRTWEAIINQRSSSSASAAPVFPGHPRGGDSDAEELAGSAEGGASSSGQGQATVLAEPVGAQSEGQEGEESDVRDLEVQKDRGLSAEPDRAQAQRRGAKRKQQTTPEPAERAREQCQRIEDIVTIKDAWDVVRRDEEIPKELKQRVGEVRVLSQRKQIRPFLKTYGIREFYWKGKERVKRVNEKLEWQRYEVVRHIVAELESLPKSHAVPEADASSASRGLVGSSGGSAAGLAEPGPSDAEYRFKMTPRTLEELMESLRDERSRAFTPLGEDMTGISLGARLSGSECYRRLVCLRFDTKYTSLPLGAQKLFAFTRAACQREREQLECTESCGTAKDLAEALQSASERHIWLQLLRAGVLKDKWAEQFVLWVHWDELAEQFLLWLQEAARESRALAEAVKHLRRGQALALVAWWAHLQRHSGAGPGFARLVEGRRR